MAQGTKTRQVVKYLNKKSFSIQVPVFALFERNVGKCKKLNKTNKQNTRTAWQRPAYWDEIDNKEFAKKKERILDGGEYVRAIAHKKKTTPL